jgi:hypothetical protein
VTRRRRGPGAAVAGLAILAIFAASAPAPVLAQASAKPKLKTTPLPPEPAASSSDPKSARTIGTSALRGDPSPLDQPLLAGPRAPEAPRPPKGPEAPAPPSFGLVAPAADPKAECRRTCASGRYQCMATSEGSCDSDWATCVIRCNLGASGGPRP